MNAQPTNETDRTLLTDAVAVAVLTLLSVVGFRSSYGGVVWLAPALIGTLAGIGTAAAARLWGLRTGLAILLALGVFLTLGPVAALRDDAFAGFIPSPHAIGALVDGSVRGWSELVTTVPPVGRAGHLLAIPFASAFCAAFAAMLVLRSKVWSQLSVVPALALLGVTVLVGTATPTSLLIEGSLLVVAVIVWSGVVDRRKRPNLGSTNPRRGLVGTIAIIAAIVVLAGVLGPVLPGASAHDRYVLRDRVEPPFDPAKYPSALVGFRNYRWSKKLDINSVKEESILTVEGVPRGTPIRIAVMNTYDDLVWRLTDTSLADSFRRTGSELLASEPKGERFHARITLNKLSGVWLPLPGVPTAVHFTDKRADVLADGFRYNRAMGAGAEAKGVAPGDTYEVDAVAPSVTPEQRDTAAIQTANPIAALPDDVTRFAQFGAKNATSTGTTAQYKQLIQLAQLFKQDGKGFYDDGENSDADTVTPPGHFYARLNQFLFSGHDFWVGNDEQYAAAFALVLQTRGIPARVVLGIRSSRNAKLNSYKGADVQAWVEVPFSGIGWVAFDPTPRDSKKKPPTIEAPRPLESRSNASLNPPPVPPRSRDTNDSASVQNGSAKPEQKHASAGGLDLRWIITALKILLIPLLIFVVPTLTILGLKRRRRERRRNAAGAAVRIAGGWREITDLLRDLGRPVPATATRRELAELTGDSAVIDLAGTVDATLFDEPEPDSTEADHVWSKVTAAERSLTGGLTRFQQLARALNLTSLRTR